MKVKFFPVVFPAIILAGLLIYVFAGNHPAHAQDSEALNMVDYNGKRQGNWIITAGMMRAEGYSSPAAKVKEGKYLDSYPVGVWKEYHLDGSVTEWAYNDDRVHAVAKRHKGSVLISEAEYENNLHQGVAKTYYSNTKVWMEMTWKDGRLDGPAKTYYPDGQLCEEGYWKYTYWESVTFHIRLR